MRTDGSKDVPLSDVTPEQREELFQLYSFQMPEDLFHFWEFCKELSPENPCGMLYWFIYFFWSQHIPFCCNFIGFYFCDFCFVKLKNVCSFLQKGCHCQATQLIQILKLKLSVWFLKKLTLFFFNLYCKTNLAKLIIWTEQKWNFHWYILLFLLLTMNTKDVWCFCFFVNAWKINAKNCFKRKTINRFDELV